MNGEQSGREAIMVKRRGGFAEGAVREYCRMKLEGAKKGRAEQDKARRSFRWRF